MIGDILGNRYEIKELIGEGGMALVYLALDTLLDRRVAIKMLRSEYSSDQEFVERFQREARSAAKLCHPNVVNIFDVGQTGETHYIVMEYVEGTSLKDLIKKEGTLTAELSLQIAFQIASALDHAHRNLIVHRDIKPHNIMIAKDYHVKVMDFGIARAISSAAITRTGVILGSVHYFSPEQATGKEVTGSSDIYSLGIVLYEMLIGKVPFEADTPVGIAYQHAKAEIPPLAQKRPDLPLAIVNLVNKALAKLPEERFKSAYEMELKIVEALDTIYGINLDKTFSNRLGSQRFLPVETETSDSTMVFDKSQTPELNERDQSMSSKDAGKKNKKSFKSLAVTFFLVILGLSLPTYLFYQISTFLNVPEVEVPSIVGFGDVKAKEELDKFKLGYTVEAEAFNSHIPKGHVITQIPEAGRTVKVNRNIQVILSKGPELLTVPDILEMDIREAQVKLQGMVLDLGEREYSETDEYAPNTIIGQMPMPGELIEKGSVINIKIARASLTRVFTMPNLISTTLSETKIILLRNGLILGDTYAANDSYLPEGYVIGQNPAPESDVAEGSIVDITISTKGEPILPPKEETSDVSSMQEHGYEIRGIKEYNVFVHVTRPGTLKIVVIDENGSTDWYNGKVREGELIQRKVSGHGVQGKSDVYVQIWLDGEILRENVLLDVIK